MTSDTVNSVESFPACRCDPGENHLKSPVLAVSETSFTGFCLSYRTALTGDDTSPHEEMVGDASVMGTFAECQHDLTVLGKGHPNLCSRQNATTC